MHSAKILADSISPDNIRLISFELTFPRSILAEVNTHRVLSKNSASSRAIPVEKMIDRVLNNPYIPTHWGKAQKGMQADFEIDDLSKIESEKDWLEARDNAVASARKLLSRGNHKQNVNRLLEPFMWHTIICSGTEWDNFFNLRSHKDAHPEIKKISDLMKDLYKVHAPSLVNYGEWHLPLLMDLKESLSLEDIKKICAGRCARVSYLTHDGKRDLNADAELCDRLLSSGHLSFSEHIARPMDQEELNMYTRYKKVNGKWVTDGSFCGNFRGWVQMRKEIPNEDNSLGNNLE